MKNSRIFVYVMEKKGLKINADKTSWYVLYTAPRAEKQVRDRIDALGVECWLPLHRAPRVWSDRVKIVELPLFNSYLFVRCTDPELRNLTRVYGVARIVYYNGKPAVVRQKEIDAIQDFLDQASEHALCPGEEVEILCGAMKHVSGKVKKIKKNHLVLYLEQLCLATLQKVRWPSSTTDGRTVIIWITHAGAAICTEYWITRKSWTTWPKDLIKKQQTTLSTMQHSKKNN